MQNQISSAQRRSNCFNLFQSNKMSTFRTIILVAILSISSSFTFAQTSSTINLSTPSAWTPIGIPLASTSNATFHGHTNWMQINSPIKTTNVYP